MNLTRINLLLGLTLLTIVLWVGFELFRTQRTRLSAPVVQQIEPLDPTLDMSVFELLRTRQVYAGLRPPSPSLVPLSTPAPIATQSANASPAGTTLQR